MGGAGFGGGVFLEDGFEVDEGFDGVVGFEEFAVLAGGDDGFADVGEDFVAFFGGEGFDLGGGEHVDVEAFVDVFGEPFGAAGFDEGGEGVEVAGLDEVFDGGEVVVDGEDEDDAGLEETVDFGEAFGGVGADGDDVAHGGDEFEMVGGEGGEIGGVGLLDGGAGGFGGEVGLFGPGFEFFADFHEHVVGEVGEGGGVAGFEEFEAPFARAGAEVEDGGGEGFWEVWFDVVPGEAVVEVPVGVVVDGVVARGDAVVVAAVGFVGGVAFRHAMCALLKRNEER